MDRLDTLAAFVAVAEHASFAEAARRLSRTPASVTRAVADLEAHLRTRLLNRTTRAVSLTEAGARHLDLARRLLSAYAEMRDLDAAERADPHGVLNVTAPANFGRLHVVPLLARFLDRHPMMDVRMLLIDRVVSLVEEGLDVGVRLGDLPDSSLRAVRVGSVALGVYASPDYLAQHGAPRTPHDLRDHRVISSTAVTPVPDRWTFEDDGDAAAVPVLPRLVVNTTDAAADAASGRPRRDALGLLPGRPPPRRRAARRGSGRPHPAPDRHSPRPAGGTLSPGEGAPFRGRDRPGLAVALRLREPFLRT